MAFWILDLLASSSASSFYDQRDLSRPIDILVLGVQNVHRHELYSSLVEFAEQHQLILKFFMEHDNISVEKETMLIHDAKVRSS